MTHRIAITMGDPAGIGPEVVLKSIAHLSGQLNARCYLFGDATVLYDTCRLLNQPFSLPVVSFGRFREQIPAESCIVDFANLHGRVQFGQERSEYGAASLQYIQEAALLCLTRQLDALLTAPINKKSIHLAGSEFPGHTELLAHLTQTSRFAMSFHTGNIWTVLTTTHIPLMEAVQRVKREHLAGIIQLAYRELQPYLDRPVLAVASLNPHGAEGGLFGMEETLEILPAIEDCRQADLPVHGPYPADTIFLRALKGDCNIVITHYHDQGMIPVKLMSFGRAVNVTLGLPFIRTSVDHGTAFDIAGRGIASPESMQEALRLTVEMLDRRSSYNPVPSG